MRWRRAPWWVFAVVFAAGVWLVDVLLGLWMGRAWSPASTSGAVLALGLGVGQGYQLHRDCRREHDELDTALDIAAAQDAAATGAPLRLRLTDADRRAALRAARSGPAPQDPVLRAAAARVVQTRSQRARSSQPLAVVVLVPVTIGAVVLALTVSEDAWPVVVLLVVIAVSSAVRRSLLHRRAAALRSNGAPAATGPGRRRVIRPSARS